MADRPPRQRHGTLGRLLQAGLGRRGITYAEAVDEALCFGWIDGIKKRVDELSYTHRFTPRRPSSNWSRANLAHVQRLRKLGRLWPTGLRAYAARKRSRSGVYSCESAPCELTPPQAAEFQRDLQAWEHFQAQPARYRRKAVWWMASARREDTRIRRLEELIAASRAGRRLAQLTSGK